MNFSEYPIKVIDDDGKLIELHAVPINWCKLCCDGRLSCVCDDPVFAWQPKI